MSRKIVVVTGCSSGFGLALARVLPRHNCTVIAGIRHESSRFPAVQAELSDMTNLELVDLDVTRSNSVRDAVDETIHRYGRIDVVINNAGVRSAGLMESTREQDFRWLFETNVLGALRVNSAALPHMRERRMGLLIHLSGTVARRVLPLTGAYAASKAALEALAEAYDSELVEFGIRSVVLEPGPHRTGMAVKESVRGDPLVTGAYQNLERFQDSLFSQEPEESMAGVVASVLNLIEQRSSALPFRTLVGKRFSYFEDSNAASAALRRASLEDAGLMDLFGCL